MPKETRQSAHVTNTNELQEHCNILQYSSSEDDEVVIHSPQFKTSISQTQPSSAINVYALYRRAKMDWTVNDNLYHRSLKWKIKCKNIIACELAMLSEARKWKQAIA